MSGPQAELVPTDGSNLALRAAALLADRAGIDDGVHLHLHKGVPVAGGMAGGSADAAATLVACDALWRTGLSRDDLLELAAELGSDVPFSLAGHTAVGSGRGHLLTPALSRGEFHWAFAVQDRGLSTADVYVAFDDLHGTALVPDQDDDVPLMQALRAGDPRALGAALHNDLQMAALELDPGLAEPLAVAQDAGALGVVVSGLGSHGRGPRPQPPARAGARGGVHGVGRGRPRPDRRRPGRRRPRGQLHGLTPSTHPLTSRRDASNT